MAEDILQQAALRQLQRPKTGRRQHSESLNFNAEKASAQDESSNKNDYLTTPRGKSRRERLESQFADFDGFNEVNCPCFIECMIHNKAMKALINTSVEKSLLSRKMEQTFRMTNRFDQTVNNSVTLSIEGSSFNIPFLTNDDSADITLGIDFLRRHKGILDFQQKTLTIDDGSGARVVTKFLDYQDVPLRFRSNHELGASI